MKRSFVTLILVVTVLIATIVYFNHTTRWLTTPTSHSATSVDEGSAATEEVRVVPTGEVVPTIDVESSRAYLIRVGAYSSGQSAINTLTVSDH